MAPSIALLIASKWQFKFFDVTPVKLPDDESALLSEVCDLALSRPANSRPLIHV